MKRIVLAIAVFVYSVATAQNVPLGEAIRNRNIKIYQNLNLDALPSPAEQGASKKKFFEGHWHGLELIALSRELRQEYDIPEDVGGLLIDEINLEAAECGFLAGDVVQSVGGYPTPTLEDFLKASMKVQNKKAVAIEIIRSAHVQALSGDIGIVDFKKRAKAIAAPQNIQKLTLELRVADYYNNLGYANMDAAPPIQPGAISPHKDRGQLCEVCHIFMNTGGQLAVDAGDIVPNPPPINQGSPCPHEPRGQCNFCHRIINPQDQSVSTPQTNPPRPQSRGIAAAFPGEMIDTLSSFTAGLNPPVYANPQAQTSTAILPPDQASPADTVGYAQQAGGGRPGTGGDLSGKSDHRKRIKEREFTTGAVGIVLILAFIYFLIFNNILGRVISFIIGAVLVLILGFKFEFYNPVQALRAINFNILAFIVGMNFIIAVLHESGFFENIAGRIAVYTKENRLGLFILFSLLTYVLSAFLDNIAVILVIVPMTLRLAKSLRIDSKPLVIAVIISSNLGGASTMFGDIPNLLITLSTTLHFMDFIIYEAPCCILLLGAMFVFMRFSHAGFFNAPTNKHDTDDDPEPDTFKLIKPVTNSRAVAQALIVMGIVITGIIFSARLAGILAFAGGVVVLIMGGIPRKNIIKHGGWGDVIFFASLFIVVGAFDASGLLYYIAQEVVLKVTGGNVLSVAIIILCLAAVITAFMNAGPTAAMFIPVVMHLGIAAPNNLFWWALSLGVVCGASASLYGATGGPLASTILLKYWKKIKKQAEKEDTVEVVAKSLDMREYLNTGLPLGAIFLVISIAYISFMYYYL